MNLNIDITDQQAANLASLTHVRSFTDGNDLISQVVANADLQATRQAVIVAVAKTQDQGVLDAVAQTIAASGGGAVRLPPILVKP